MKLTRCVTWLFVSALLASMTGFPAGAEGGSGVSRQISSAGTSAPQTGAYTPSGESDATYAEFPGQLDEADGSPGP